MTKRRTNKSGRRNSGFPSLKNIGNEITKFSGRMLQPVTYVANTIQKSVVNPTAALFGTRLNAAATLFNLYRFVKLRVTALPTAGSNLAMAYDSSPNANAPTTFAALLELARAKFQASAQIVPVAMTLLGNGLRKTPAKWFVTRETAADDNIENQGEIYIGTDQNSTRFIMVEYEVEFCQPSPPAVYLKGAAAPVQPKVSSSAVSQEEKDDDSDFAPVSLDEQQVSKLYETWISPAEIQDFRAWKSRKPPAP